ncbi:hypothetical protein CPC08DRAFT_717260 [Agrocybe pediades]|nr:hypothetical protein CPC08DRAFT_717260 [Agrocybe pediades]
MDFLKNKLSGSSNSQTNQGSATSSQGSGGGFMNNINNSMGGGQAGEKNEDYLDKGVDMFQEHVLHQGPQNNESAMEQAKDEQISDGIRRAYKSSTGRDFPVADK